MTEEASCSRCANRTSDVPHVCTWSNAELSPRLPDDVGCEGFVPSKSLRADEVGIRPKGDDETVDKTSRTTHLRTQQPKRLSTTLPKTVFEQPEKNILEALGLKEHGGRVYREKVCCGKKKCHCCRNGSLHGPYAYLRWFQDGKGRKKYLGRGLAVLVSKTREELEAQLEEILGQENRSSETSGGV